jgi:hypothetical protein
LAENRESNLFISRAQYALMQMISQDKIVRGVKKKWLKEPALEASENKYNPTKKAARNAKQS